MTKKSTFILFFKFMNIITFINALYFFICPLFYCLELFHLSLNHSLYKTFHIGKFSQFLFGNVSIYHSFLKGVSLNTEFLLSTFFHHTAQWFLKRNLSFTEECFYRMNFLCCCLQYSSFCFQQFAYDVSKYKSL